ncbi:hypothetical protein D3C73_884720 [compost metagenome]
MTLVTGHIDIRQEVHLNLNDAVTLTILAAATLNVKAKSSSLIATNIRFWRTCEKLTNWSKDARISCRV